jgi:hypothetical protein
LNFIKISFIFACLQGCSALQLTPYTQYDGLNKATISFEPITGAVTYKEAKHCKVRLALNDERKRPLVRSSIQPNVVFPFWASYQPAKSACSFFGFFVPQENRNYFLETEFVGNQCKHQFYELIGSRKVKTPIDVSIEEKAAMTENSEFCNSDNTTNYTDGEFSTPLIRVYQTEIPIIL